MEQPEFKFRGRMLGPQELESDLIDYQTQLEKSYNNPEKEAYLLNKVNKCLRQLKLWNDLRASVQ